MNEQNQSATYADRRLNCDPQVLDFQHLGQYTSGDEALERELLGLFADQVSAQFAALVDAQSTDDWVMAAHTLKGSARGIGANGVDAAAKSLEQIGFNAPEAVKLAAIGQVKEQIAKCTAEIERIAPTT